MAPLHKQYYIYIANVPSPTTMCVSCGAPVAKHATGEQPRNKSKLKRQGAHWTNKELDFLKLLLENPLVPGIHDWNVIQHAWKLNQMPVRTKKALENRGNIISDRLV